MPGGVDIFSCALSHICYHCVRCLRGCVSLWTAARVGVSFGCATETRMITSPAAATANLAPLIFFGALTSQKAVYQSIPHPHAHAQSKRTPIARNNPGGGGFLFLCPIARPEGWISSLAGVNEDRPLAVAFWHYSSGKYLFIRFVMVQRDKSNNSLQSCQITVLLSAPTIIQNDSRISRVLGVVYSVRRTQSLIAKRRKKQL